MAIPEYHIRNFETLLHAAAHRQLALVECTDAETGEARYVICAVGGDGAGYVITPFCHLPEGNPYLAYIPPATGGQGGATDRGGRHG